MFDHQGILTHVVDADDAGVQPDPVQASWDMHDLIHGDGAGQRRGLMRLRTSVVQLCGSPSRLASITFV